MKTTVDNDTKYDTRAIKAVVTACERHLSLRQSRLIVVSYSKKSMLWGWASYGHRIGGVLNEGHLTRLFLCPATRSSSTSPSSRSWSSTSCSTTRA